jgi:MFS family permease
MFRYGLMTGFITFMAISGVMILIPFYLENVLGYDIEHVGLMLAVVPVVLGIVAPISGVLSDKFGSRLITVIGLVILVGGYIAMSSLSAGTTTVGYILRLVPIGLGMGIFQSPNNSAIMGAVARNRLGVASGLLSMTRTVGQTTGLAISGAVWAILVALSFGGLVPDGATAAPIQAQVAGLQQTFLGIAGLVFVALLLSLWGWAAEKRAKPG